MCIILAMSKNGKWTLLSLKNFPLTVTKSMRRAYFKNSWRMFHMLNWATGIFRYIRLIWWETLIFERKREKKPLRKFIFSIYERHHFYKAMDTIFRLYLPIIQCSIATKTKPIFPMPNEIVSYIFFFFIFFRHVLITFRLFMVWRPTFSVLLW